MAKKNKNRRSGFSANTIYRLIRIGALVAPAASIAIGQGTNESKLNDGVRAYMGFDMSTGTFSWQDLGRGWMPSVGAAVATYGVPKIGGAIRRLLKF